MRPNSDSQTPPAEVRLILREQHCCLLGLGQTHPLLDSRQSHHLLGLGWAGSSFGRSHCLRRRSKILWRWYRRYGSEWTVRLIRRWLGGFLWGIALPRQCSRQCLRPCRTSHSTGLRACFRHRSCSLRSIWSGTGSWAKTANPFHGDGRTGC